MKRSPAEYVINIFGGVRKTARKIGRDASSVCKWRKPKNKRGTGGKIPRGAQEDILICAKRERLDITPHDLIFGR